MRDRLTHGYFDINWEIVWNVLQNDIQPLKKVHHENNFGKWMGVRIIIPTFALFKDTGT